MKGAYFRNFTVVHQTLLCSSQLPLVSLLFKGRRRRLTNIPFSPKL